jgi:succinoglycan biosynthesis protein ExoA
MNTVSIIIPCLNEEKTINTVLQAVYDQSYLRTSLEVIVADGGSVDGTLERIRQFHDAHPELVVKVIPNAQKQIPIALNLAIHAAKGEIIIRMDAHSLPQEDYVATCVKDLLDKKGDNIGGRWDIIPGANTWEARGIAAAAAHPLGVGNVRYRISGEAGPVDTVPFGCYYRSLFDRIGMFDETLSTNEDYELNTRIRKQGGIIWFDPNIVCRYFSRPTLADLARQYWRYGFWKAKMVKKYPTSMKLRQMLPPIFVAGMFILLVTGLFSPLFLTGLLGVFLLYLGIIVIASVPEARKRNDRNLAMSLPLAIMTMHITWGAGFIVSLFN